MSNDNPYPGGAELAYTQKKNKKQKKKQKPIERNGIICTCGALDQFYTTLYYMHSNRCVINTKGKK